MNTALASWPRSGNTWLRQMVESATGQKSGSVYQHFSGVMEDGTRDGIVVKTHELETDGFGRAIHLLRDPFDAIWSFYHWRRDVNREQDLDWAAHVWECLTGWRNWPAHTEYWLAGPIPVLRVFYEDLHRRGTYELGRVLDWLGEPRPEGAIKTAIEASSLETMRARWGPAFIRQGTMGAGRQAFGQPEWDLVARYAGKTMARVGYDV